MIMKINRNKMFCVMMLMAGLLLGARGQVRAAELEGKTADFSTLPAMVQKSIQAQSEGGKWGQVTQTLEDGETNYSLTISSGQGRSRNFVFDEHGREISREVFMSELARPVQRAIHRHAEQGGRIKEISKSTDDGEVSYDVLTVKEDKTRTFSLSEDGELLEMQVFMDELPAAVQTALEKERGTGKCGDISKVPDDEETVYETEITQDGKTRSISLNAKGVIVHSEQGIALAEVPEVVRKVVDIRLADAKPEKIDKVVEEGAISYLIEWTSQGTHHSLIVAADGKVSYADREPSSKKAGKP